MKKASYIRTGLRITTQAAIAQTPADVVGKYSDISGVMKQSVNKEMLPEDAFAQIQQIAVNGHVDSLTVMHLANCDTAVKREFLKDISSLEESDSFENIAFETPLPEGATMKLMKKTESELVRGVYMFMYMAPPESAATPENWEVAAIIIFHGEMEDVNIDAINNGM